jgi:hypothetical protein
LYWGSGGDSAAPTVKAENKENNIRQGRKKLRRRKPTLEDADSMCGSEKPSAGISSAAARHTANGQAVRTTVTRQMSQIAPQNPACRVITPAGGCFRAGFQASAAAG